MEEYLFHIFLGPLALAFLYMLFIAFKKQSEAEQFFVNYDTLNRETLIRKLEFLEQEKQLNLSPLKARINGIRQRHIEHFANDIDTVLEKIYFDYFKDNWIAFRKASWALKIVFFSGLLIGFYIFGYILYRNGGEELSIWVFLLPFILFPVSFVLSFIYIMILSVFLTLFRFFAPRRGAVVYSCVLFNCMIKAVGPGRTGGGVSDVNHSMDFLY